MQQVSIYRWLNHPNLQRDTPISPLQDNRTPLQGLRDGNSTRPDNSEPIEPKTTKNETKLPKNVSIEPCHESHVQSLRRLNSLLLPISYQNSFYKEILNNAVISSVTRVAVWHEHLPENGGESLKDDASGSGRRVESGGRVVAGIRCRLLSEREIESTSKHTAPVLYVSTIGTLAPFRGHGLATRLLHEVALNAAESHGVKSIKAHVWEANQEALEWYKKRGFRVVNREENYYQALSPNTAAWVVRKDIATSEVLAWQNEIRSNTRRRY